MGVGEEQLSMVDGRCGDIFVIQNLRGRFGSEGTFADSDPRRTPEVNDAWDTIAWL